MSRPGLGWAGIARLGLVQASLGAIVVLTTSTLNRVMVVELALPAVLPGLLVGLHYGMQLLRPRLGHGSDVGGRRTPWIVGGMAVLAAGGVLAAVATAFMSDHVTAGIALAVLAFLLIGLGVGASGTSLLVLLAQSVVPERRPAAATLVWIMMILGFIVTSITAGNLLDPYSPERLVAVTSGICLVAWVVTVGAVWGVEGRRAAPSGGASPAAEPHGATFTEALREVWREPEARRFTAFVFVSMLAYSSQDLILEPFAGAVFGYSPGESTKLSGVQQTGVLLGMLLAAWGGTGRASTPDVLMRRWAIGGCLASAIALATLAFGAWQAGAHWPLSACVFALGVANGAYAVAAIGSMMTLADQGHARREGVRMGLWGAAQAIAFGAGGFLGALAVDVARAWTTTASAYGSVFLLESLLFIASAGLALRLGRGRAEAAPSSPAPVGAWVHTSGRG